MIINHLLTGMILKSHHLDPSLRNKVFFVDQQWRETNGIKPPRASMRRKVYSVYLPTWSEICKEIYQPHGWGPIKFTSNKNNTLRIPKDPPMEGWMNLYSRGV